MASDDAVLLKSTDPEGIAVTKQHGSAFFDVSTLPWSPWVMEETWFKLLAVNPVTGGFTMMLKVGPDNVAPIHGHVGSVEGMITSGGFAYEDDWGHAGDFVHEPAGINHKPHTGPEGMEMFAVVHGPLVGYGDDGGIAGVVDARFMYDLAVAANVAEHIEKPSHW